MVASPLALEGLGVTAGEHCLVAETDEQVVAAVSELLDDAARRSRLAGAAYAWAAANLGWGHTVAAYDALYDRLLDGTNDGGKAAEMHHALASEAVERRVRV
jgi:hypothetical protein